MKKNLDAESVAESDDRFSLGSCGLGWQVDPASSLLVFHHCRLALR